YDPTSNRPLLASEWDDLFDILCQAQKKSWAKAWVAEESALKLLFGPADFWISLREPKQGAWPPPDLPGDRPRIAPETVKVDDLPDETSGQDAIDLWNARRQELNAFRGTLVGRSRDMAGATRRITDALGVAIGDLEDKYAQLLSTTPAEVAAGRTYVEE